MLKICRWCLLCVVIIPGISIAESSYYLIHLVPGERWTAEKTLGQQPDAKRHEAYTRALFERDIAQMIGPTDNREGFLVLVRARDLSTAEAIAAADPLVSTGVLSAHVLSWKVARSSLRLPKKRLPRVSPNEPFKLERRDPNSPITLPEQPPS